MWEEDAIFNNVRKEVNKPTRTAREKATFISEATWRLADQRTSLRLIHTVGQKQIWAAMRIFKAQLQ